MNPKTMINPAPNFKINVLALTTSLIATNAFAVPTLEWSWTSSSVAPSSLNVMGVPSIIDLTEDGVPEVVFTSTASTGGALVETGFLRAIDGASGSELFTVTGTMLNTTTSVATGDIDNDGRIEIIAGSASGNQLVAFEHDGAIKWTSAVTETNYWGAPSIADMNQDGTPEVIFGRQVLDNNGNLLWTGSGDRGSQGATGPLSLVADVDLDQSYEVIAGKTVYESTGGIEAQNLSFSDGFNAVANFDGDDQAEIVLVSGGTVSLFNHDMSVIWSGVSLPGGGAGGPPTIADFDGDGAPEIGVAGASRYTVFDTDGTVLWETVVQDSSSNRTGSSVYDFDGDGRAEVVYSDELSLMLLDGLTGVRLWETSLSSCTWHEYPLVADVDADGSAEIVAVANNNCGFGPERGIYVFGDDDNWVGTRPIWNQHTYHITNILLDGSIPTYEDPNWLQAGLNDFRLNEYAPGEDPNIPVPPTALLVGLGLAGIAYKKRKRS